MIRSLAALGMRVVDGKSVLEHARAVKSAEEIRAFRVSLATWEQSVRSLYGFAVPGVKESEGVRPSRPVRVSPAAASIRRPAC